MAAAAAQMEDFSSPKRGWLTIHPFIVLISSQGDLYCHANRGQLPCATDFHDFRRPFW